MKSRQIKKIHNSVVEHGGLEMTMSRLAQQGQAWTYMRTHIKFKQCALSTVKISIQAHHFETSSYTPMSLLTSTSLDLSIQKRTVVIF